MSRILTLGLVALLLAASPLPGRGQSKKTSTKKTENQSEQQKYGGSFEGCLKRALGMGYQQRDTVYFCRSKF